MNQQVITVLIDEKASYEQYKAQYKLPGCEPFHPIAFRVFSQISRYDKGVHCIEKDGRKHNHNRHFLTRCFDSQRKNHRSIKIVDKPQHKENDHPIADVFILGIKEGQEQQQSGQLHKHPAQAVTYHRSPVRTAMPTVRCCFKKQKIEKSDKRYAYPYPSKSSKC